jgi:uncharacterized oligopeptide transporter (OPT) family protein
MRRHSIIENNINQTLASAVNGASGRDDVLGPGAVHPRVRGLQPPARRHRSIAGGILGIAFIIPLRKQMIDFDRLAYPGGIATAAMLKAPGAGSGRRSTARRPRRSAPSPLHLSLSTGFENWNLGAQIGMPEYMNGTWYVSLLTVGVAFLAGKGGFFFIVGGFVSYWILAPLLARRACPSDDERRGGETHGLPALLFQPVGIGMLVGGAVMGIVFALPLVVSAIRSMQSDAAKTRSAVSRATSCRSSCSTWASRGPSWS